MSALADQVRAVVAEVGTPYRALRDLGRSVAIDGVPDYWPARIRLCTALRAAGWYVTEMPVRSDRYMLHVYPNRAAWLGRTAQSDP